MVGTFCCIGESPLSLDTSSLLGPQRSEINDRDVGQAVGSRKVEVALLSEPLLVLWSTPT